MRGLLFLNGWEKRSMLKKWMKPALALAVPAIYMFYRAHHDVLKNDVIVDERLPEKLNGFRIFFIADIHRRKIRMTTLETIDKPIHAVIIGGDLREKWVPLSRTRRNLKVLKRWGAPVYFVWGNNDIDAGKAKLQSLLLNDGITILADSTEVISYNGNELFLTGADYKREEEASYDELIRGLPPGHNIVAAHVPSVLEHVDKRLRGHINLFLAGHTHGGQIRIFGKGLYSRGKYEIEDGIHRLVSEGYGYRLIPFRLGTRSECHVLTLKNKP